MPATGSEAPPRTYARVTGLLYLINVVIAGVAPIHVLPRLVVEGDPAATAGNISASPWMLHLAVASDLATVLIEVALCGLFYLLLRPVDRDLALIMALFRVAYTAIVINNVRHLYAPLRLLTDDPLTALPADDRAALATVSLDAYHDGFTIALLFFGVHVLLLGVLLRRSGYVPKPLGTWLVLGSLGYFLYSLANLTVRGADIPLVVVAPVALGELALIVLLVAGRVNRSPSSPHRPASWTSRSPKG